MKLSPQSNRRGVALMFVAVVMMVVSAIILSLTFQMVANHRMLEHRLQQQQSLWLARSGMELAVAHLCSDPKYRGETKDLIPFGEVKITIDQDKKTPDLFRITSEARFPKDLRDVVVRSITSRYRRIQNGSTSQIEMVAPDVAKK